MFRYSSSKNLHFWSSVCGMYFEKFRFFLEYILRKALDPNQNFGIANAGFSSLRLIVLTFLNLIFTIFEKNEFLLRGFLWLGMAEPRNEILLPEILLLKNRNFYPSFKNEILGSDWLFWPRVFWLDSANSSESGKVRFLISSKNF